MSPVPPTAVSALRARTGVPILACKEALEEAQGNEEKAIEILRRRGIAQAVKKSAREQHDGAVFLTESGSKAALVLLKCETDFVACADAFRTLGRKLALALLTDGTAKAKALADQEIPASVQQLGENISVVEALTVEAPVLGTYVHSNSKIGVIIGLDSGTKEQAHDVAMHAAAMNPLYVRPEDVPPEAIEKEKEIWREQLKKEGKPETIWDKIMLGKEKKFREENALAKQPFVKDSAKTVEQYLGSAKITAYSRLSIS
jgi:elongation factor Ts